MGGQAVSLCPFAQQAGPSCPLFLLVFPRAAGKSEKKLDGKALGGPALTISAFWGSDQVGSDSLTLFDQRKLPKSPGTQSPHQ